MFAALASPIRREVLRLLREQGPQPVAELAAHFDMARPSFSEQLRVLRESGLVAETKAGRRRIYRLQAEPLLEVQEWLHPYERFWRGKLTALAGLLDELPDEPSPPGPRPVRPSHPHRPSRPTETRTHHDRTRGPDRGPRRSVPAAPAREGVAGPDGTGAARPLVHAG
ncbi:metalloregulator ArsR/SmtB family transcription factor [Streptomyces sp. NBC_00320]|uniref:ArsR/SmtB family transcription factor n=1 Tax=Streptomyces sp. NBC_00320 TaxID=2975711 RepID=UPI002B1E834F|nr:metalloregulator ArsR/SmtB family transcription factor [Streptomyces sp. NBC_00320]